MDDGALASDGHIHQNLDYVMPRAVACPTYRDSEIMLRGVTKKKEWDSKRQNPLCLQL
jgi:hypothetical protein